MNTEGDVQDSMFPKLTAGPSLRATVERIVDTLLQKHTLKMCPNRHGLYPASSSQADISATGMHHTWLRDNVMVGHSLLATGEFDAAVRCAHGLMSFALTQAPKMEAIIEFPAFKHNMQDRPHARFDGQVLRETNQPWGHGQSDAWGYLAWFVAGLSCTSHMALSSEEEQLLFLIPRYMDAIEYHIDADNGTWEEDPKVNSSSIAACIAGLRAISRYAEVLGRGAASSAISALTEPLILRGFRTLNNHLPFESFPSRMIDAAVLFAVYPTGVISDRYMQDLVISLIQSRLAGPRGTRRYLGDSYYCQDYDQWFDQVTRSNDHGLSNALRNQFLEPGMEAQWCIFDPILSTIYGERYLERGELADLARQLRFANRSLSQVAPTFQCPELYYSSAGRWIPNVHTPLLWTQANLAIAIKTLRRSAERYQELSTERTSGG